MNCKEIITSAFDPCDYWSVTNLYIQMFVILCIIGLLYGSTCFLFYLYTKNNLIKIAFCIFNLIMLVVFTLHNINFKYYWNTPQIETATTMGILLVVLYLSTHLYQIYKYFYKLMIKK
jgi:hypothetical protein